MCSFCLTALVLSAVLSYATRTLLLLWWERCLCLRLSSPHAVWFQQQRTLVLCCMLVCVSHSAWFALYRSLCMIHTLSQHVLPPFTRVVLHNQLGPCRHFRRNMEPPETRRGAALKPANPSHEHRVRDRTVVHLWRCCSLPSSQRNWTASRTGAAHQPRIHMVRTSFERVVEQQSSIRSA